MSITDKSCGGRLQMGEKREGEGRKGGERKACKEERQTGQGLD